MKATRHAVWHACQTELVTGSARGTEGRQRRRAAQRTRRANEDNSVQDFRRKRNAESRRASRTSLHVAEGNSIRHQNTAARRLARSRPDHEPSIPNSDLAIIPW
jgi:hypothetical protein